MKWLKQRALRIAGALFVLIAGGWGTLFLRYRMPGGTVVAATVAALWFVATLCVGGVLWLYPEWRWVGAIFVVGFAALCLWYVSIVPRGAGDWAADVSQPFTACVVDGQLIVDHVRDFAWRSDDDFTAAWQERRYCVEDVRSVDLFNSYWAGPLIAHTILSFGFADGRHLAFSFEIRRKRGEAFSTFAGFFKHYELVVIAADERDVIRVRSNVRHEDVQLYRLRVTQQQARAFLLAVVARANGIAAKPVFYNSLDRNCTTEMFGAARAVAPNLPFSWRIILSGQLPRYAYDNRLLDSRLPFETIQSLSHIAARAAAADQAADFSAQIRQGVPNPGDSPQRPTEAA